MVVNSKRKQKTKDLLKDLFLLYLLALIGKAKKDKLGNTSMYIFLAIYIYCNLFFELLMKV